ncbi:MAG: protein phosphatase 2C domain-containing protein [Opitutaceae bacterium]|nr:protein phosphatase 2C domain-containing protein [Opitutaceae bacterium]
MNVLSTGYALARSEDAACDDAWLVRERNGVTIAAVADGISAAREGGAAARRAVEMLADYCLSRPRAWSPRRALADFVAQINRHLHTESLARHGQPELACTLSAVLIEEGRLYGCNIGDSPVFRWHRGGITRLSEAHVVAAPELAHVLTRAVGLAPEIEPHFFEAELAAGDVVLLCSDGVANVLPPEQLADLLSRQATARSLVARARAMTEDNPELRDDACAVVLELAPGERAGDPTRRPLEVIRTLRAGDTIDGHRLVRSLGGNHRVWLAEAPPQTRAPKLQPPTRVVLKFPDPEATDTEALREAFLREVRTALRLTSPDLVRAWVPEGLALRCYAMEFVNAPTLRSVLLTSRLGVEDARELARFLLRTGQFLLGHDLAHGDIKPDNILVLREAGGVSFRLLDLGSASEVFSVTSRAGTPSYLAPERFRGSALAERTEIFAIGVTLYEALTGAYPYGEVERFQTPRFDRPPRRLVRHNPAVPPWLDHIILRALDPDPERRYQLFSEMAYELAHPARVAPHHRKDAPLLERNPLRFYKGLSAALFLVVLVLLYLLLQR